MLGLAALVLAAASVDASPALASASPWWERLIMTMSADGAQQSCRYESSTAAGGPEDCGGGDPSSRSIQHKASAVNRGYTRITIERRFTPTSGRSSAGPLADKMPPTGDTLLAGQVMALAIDSSGSVRSCRIVSSAGDLSPPYGCSDVRSERFESSTGRALSNLRRGYMTILVYGHEEHLT